MIQSRTTELIERFSRQRRYARLCTMCR